MKDALTARRVAGADGRELWLGLGASQSKGGLAAVCAAIALLQDQGVELGGRVLVGACSEGGSSHESSTVLYEALEPLPAGAVLTVGTDNRISLGNRGRVDVVVEIPGLAAHSSSVELGRNPIPVVAEVQRRLETLVLDPEPHPLLGRRTLVQYKLTCGPIAPHTIPAWCLLVLDRRLLPGDAPDDAVAEVAARTRRPRRRGAARAVHAARSRGRIGGGRAGAPAGSELGARPRTRDLLSAVHVRRRHTRARSACRR